MTNVLWILQILLLGIVYCMRTVWIARSTEKHYFIPSHSVPGQDHWLTLGELESQFPPLQSQMPRIWRRWRMEHCHWHLSTADNHSQTWQTNIFSSFLWLLHKEYKYILYTGLAVIQRKLIMWPWCTEQNTFSFNKTLLMWINISLLLPALKHQFDNFLWSYSHLIMQTQK